MGGGGKNKAPKAPDYAGLAQQDAEQQRITAEQITASNRPTQIDQYGNSLNWSKDAAGNPIQTVNMDPTIKAGQDANIAGYYDRMRGLDAQGGFTSPGALQYSNQNYDLAGGGIGSRPSYSGGGGSYSSGGGGSSSSGGGGAAPSGVTVPKDYYGEGAGFGPTNPMNKYDDVGVYKGGYKIPKTGTIGEFSNSGPQMGVFDSSQGDKVAADLYESVMGRTRIEQGRETAALDNKLRLQGLQPGTAAYDRAAQNLMTSQGDVSTQAGLNSTLAGYNAARDIYNTNMAGNNQNFQQGLAGYGANLTRQDNLANQALGRGQLMQDRYATNMQGNMNTADNLAARDIGYAGQEMGRVVGEAGNASSERNAATQAAAARASAAASAAASRYSADLNYNLGVAQQRQSEQAQMWNQALTEYQLPQNMASGYAGLMGQAPGPAFQGFGGATGYNPASMSNAAQSGYNANMAGYNAQQGKKNNLMQTGGTLGGAAIMASDMSLKENIKPLVGEDAVNAIMRMGGYSFDWKDGTGNDMGVMAQEVQRVLPELVVRAEAGHLMVNYTGIVALAVEAIKHLAGSRTV